MLSRFVRHGYDVHMLVPRAPGRMESQPGLTVHAFANVLRVPRWLPAGAGAPSTASRKRIMANRGFSTSAPGIGNSSCTSGSTCTR